MAAPLLLSDENLNVVRTTFAAYFKDPEPFRRQIEITRRVAAAVAAVGGATAANAPSKWQYINLVVAFDELSNGDFSLAQFMASQSTTQTLPDAATYYHALLDKDFPSLIPVQMKLFDQFPTQVLCSLIGHDKLTTSLDATTKQKVVNTLQTAIVRGFSIGKDSIETLIANPAYASSVGSSDAAKAFMRKLGRLAVLVRLPQDLAFLWDTNFDSASVIAHTPRTSFVTIITGKGMLEDSAVAVHDHAEMIDLRNDQAWTALLASKSAWSPAVMSSTGTSSTPSTAAATTTTSELAGQIINYSNLFGDIYINPCDDCSSVTSPAAYYVDLLRMLKNCPSNPAISNSASLLSKLIERRPDLLQLQLTCANTNILIPYVDLANEAMESFISNMSAGGTTGTVPIQAFNMTDNDQSLRNTSQPQKTQLSVYRDVIDVQVFPLNIFPYNQAIDTIRAFASAFGASRYELMATFQTVYTLSPSKNATGTANYERESAVLKSALAAELLNLQPADFVAITGSSVYSKAYYTNQSGTQLDQAVYAAKVGLGGAHSYWGYASSEAMLADAGGLPNMVKQFLVRASISLQELLNLLRSRFLGGRLTLGNTADVPIFSTNITDLRLRHPSSSNPKGNLTAVDCFALQAFIRLWRKSGWTMSDLDLGLSYFCDQSGAAENIPLIPADAIASLSAVQEIQNLTEYSIERLMPLWGLIDTFGDASLYSKLFLQGDSTKNDPVFGPDSKGCFLTNSQIALSSYRSTVAAALGIPDEHYMSMVWGARVQNDVLNLANISAIYRVYLLCQILDINPLQYSGFITLFKPGFSPFSTPQDTVRTLKEWRACVEEGMSLPQALYITGIDQVLQLNNPGYGVSDKTMLDVVCNILTGLLTIERNVPLGSAITASTASANEVTRIANLVFDPETAPQVVEFIEGTGTVPRTVTSSIYQDVLQPHLKKNENEARSLLFDQTQPTGTAEDVAITLETQQVDRRLLFLRAVSPVLKSRLTNELIVNCTTLLVPGNDTVLARALVSDIIRNSARNMTAFQILGGLLETNTQAPAGVGPAYFQPPSTDTYKFHFTGLASEVAPNVTVDGIPLTFVAAGPVWTSNEFKLTNGQSYTLRYNTPNFTNATFSNVRSAGLPFSSDVLVYSETLRNAIEVLQPLLRAAQFIVEFELDIPSIYFMHNQAGSTTLAVNFSKITYDDVRRAQRYNNLRKRTVASDLHVVEYFQWVASQQLDTALEEKLSALTGVSRSQIHEFLSAKFPNFTPTALLDIFRKDTEISDLLTAVEFTSRFGIPGIGFNLLFQWATPLEPTATGQYYNHAAEMRRIAQSLPVGDSDNSPVAKANDQIRINQRQALATYLLQQDFMKTRGILDFGNLFEYFLIDVQMSPCLQTSRLKQAISTIQLFVQRCILGLEKSRGVASGTVNLDRWSWMQKYRLWEANRKVFLYPENYLEPSLRDNKSEVFQALEAELLQTDINNESIKRLVRNYIYGANAVANLVIEAYSWDRRDDGNGTLHFFGRTRQGPYVYYHRSAAVKGVANQQLESFTQWTAWKKMDVEIRPIEVDAEGKALPYSGTYLTPAIKDRRVFLFLPVVTLKNVAPTSDSVSTKSIQNTANDSPRGLLPSQYWQIQIAWTEYRNGIWSPKIVAPAALSVAGARDNEFYGVGVQPSGDWSSCTASPPNEMMQEAKKMPSASSFRFTAYTRPGSGDLSVLTIVVDRWIGPVNGRYVRYPCGAFELQDEEMILLDRDSFDRTTYAMPCLDTVPTRFNKFIWPASKTDLAPSYTVARNYLNGWSSKLYWGATGTLPAQQRSDSTFTLSFDMSRFSAASHGLVREIKSLNSTQTLFNQVKIAGKSNNDYTISTSDEMSNTLWPAVLNATTTDSRLGPAYAVLSKDMTDTAKYQLFGARNVDRNETSVPTAIYIWEFSVHIVMLLMERLRDLQQFEYAMQIARYVFDPTIDGSNLNRCWKFLPFKEIASGPIQTTEALLQSLSASSGAESTMSPTILASRENPFDAHAIARGRTSAYMKRFVMTYIELLIGGGDEYFRQNTLESLPLALQYYVQASHLFGSAPSSLPKIGRRAARSYAQLETSFNDLGNSVFDLELDFPFWCDPSKRGGTVTNTSTSYGLTGMMRSTYFCVPTNPQLVQLNALIEDRLFKIRNCQDINGVTRSLSLFEPPIDVRAAVRAMAAGISVNALLSDTVGPMPNIRFATLLAKALDLCSELKAMGAAFQAVKETRDAEALAALQAKQERVMQEMTMTTKNLAKDEVLKSLEELRETRRSHVSRLKFWLQLTGDKKSEPTETSDWEDIEQNIETPSTDGQATTKYDREEIDKTNTALGAYLGANIMDGIAAAVLAVPEITMNCEPLGVGATVGGIAQGIGACIAGFAGVARGVGDVRLVEASQAAKNAELVTRLQERRMEANAAGRDIKIVDKQIATLQVGLSMCEEDIRQQEKMIAHATEISDFLRTKYTSEQLYIWIDGQIRNLFYQTYLLANDLAKKAQKTYRFERVADSTEYIAQSYWNASRDGLLSGEQLYLALKRLEIAYDAHKGHDFEIKKSVSLRKLNPLALINLQETGAATFALPEVLFDYDYPGHYMRRIKTLSVAVPTKSDIDADLCATLRLIEHRYRTTAVASSGQDYPMKSINDDRFRTSQLPISAIAVSKASGDSGVFDYELEFNDFQRYVPFEGAGVVSRWQLELPTAIKAFDYSLISDVVVDVQYTSMNGGVAFRKSASDAAKAFQGSVTGLSASEGLFTVVDVANSYPEQWTTFSAKSTSPRTVTLSNLQNQLPFFAVGRKVKVETITALITATETNISWASNLTLTGQTPVAWKTGFDVGRYKTITQTGLAERFTDWTIGLTAAGGNAELKSLKFLVRYYLQ